MSGFKQAIRSLLAADATVSGLVSTRIYQETAPTSANLPYITMSRVSSQHEHDMEAAAGLAMKRLQIDCYAATSAACESLVEAVRDALDGLPPNTTQDSVNFRTVHLENETDNYLPPMDANQVGVHRTTMDFLVWHFESVPTFA